MTNTVPDTANAVLGTNAVLDTNAVRHSLIALALLGGAFGLAFLLPKQARPEQE